MARLDAAEVASHGGPGYVLVRPAEPESAAAAHLEARPDRFRKVYERDGFRVYQVEPAR